MNILTAPDVAVTIARPAVMLCGGITNCDDWQASIISGLSGFQDGTILNPRREVWNPDDADAQYEWEWNMSRLADAAVFWFPDESVCPVSLMALGTHLPRPMKLFVGYDSGYSNAEALVDFVGRARPNVAIQTSLEDLIAEVLAFATTAELRAAKEVVDGGVRSQVIDELRHFADRMEHASKMDQIPPLSAWIDR